MVITYTGTVQVTVNPGATLTNNAALTWTSLDGGNSLTPDAGERYGIVGDPVNNYFDTDTRSVTIATGTFDKQLFSTSDAGTAGSLVAIGENVTYALVVTLPAGTTQRVMLAINFGIRIESACEAVAELMLDGALAKSVPFRIAASPAR